MKPPPFEISHLDHVVLRTRQLAELVSFYRSLGCRVERDRVQEMGMMQLRLGSSMLDIVSIKEDTHPPETGDGRNLDHFAVRIEPFDEAAILDFCAARSIPAQAMPVPILGADGLGPAIYIEDPDGNRMELKGPPVEKD
jgi:catechol 2,3-dioxygenase-like lactoylglutathione lyase family enzyme